MRPVSALALLLATAAGSSLASATPARPTAWKYGSYVVPLESYDPAQSNLIDGSSVTTPTSSYADVMVQNVPWPLSTHGGLLVEDANANPLRTLGFYNTAWSQDAGGATAGAVFLKSQTAGVTAKLYVDLTKQAGSPVGGVIGSRVWFIVMGVNSFIEDEGSAIGTLTVFQNKNGTITPQSLVLILGDNIRSFKTSTIFCNGPQPCIGESVNPLNYGTWTLSTNPPPQAQNLWTGPCTSAGEQCFLDAVSIAIPAADVKYPIVGVEVDVYKYQTVIQNPPQTVRGAVRLHGITIETQSIEAQNNGQSVVPLSQGGNAVWACDRYGGRTIGGVLYGPKRNIQEIGCALTSGTIAGNYYTGMTKTPRDVNQAIQQQGSYVASDMVGEVANFTASWQQRCDALTDENGAAIALNDCDCCEINGNCAANCPPNAPVTQEVVNVCCRVRVTPGLPNGATGQGSTVEVRPTCDPSNNSCLHALDTFTCKGTSYNAMPAVMVNKEPVAALEILPAAHPFDLSQCVLISTPGYDNLYRHATTYAPCQPGLRLATVAAVSPNAPATLEVGQRVGFYELVPWELGGVFGSIASEKVTVGAGLVKERKAARDIEAAIAKGLVPILHVRDPKSTHFVVARGIAPKFMAQQDSVGAIEIPAGGGFAGTYLVADPGSAASADLIDSFNTTLAKKKSRNKVFGYRMLTVAAAATARLNVRVFSPAELLVSDGVGGKVGYDPALGVIEPTFATNASYDPVYEILPPDAGPDDPSRELYKEAYVEQADGSYRVALIGTGFGRAGVGVVVDHSGGNPEEMWREAYVHPGSVNLYQVTLSADGATPATITDLPVPDADGDGYGPPADCDDQNMAIVPFGAESCANGVDDDCNGLVDGADPQCAGGAPLCPDADGDGWSDCLVPGCDHGGLACGDCDDANGGVHPGAAEGPGAAGTCGDGLDNDCDGATDVALPACLAIAPPAEGYPGWAVGGGGAGGMGTGGMGTGGMGTGGVATGGQGGGTGGQGGVAAGGQGGSTGGQGGVATGGQGGGTGGQGGSAAGGQGGSAGGQGGSATGGNGAGATGTTSGGGDSTSGGAGTGGDETGGSGCGCRVPVSGGDDRVALTALLAGLGVLVRRRRRGS